MKFFSFSWLQRWLLLSLIVCFATIWACSPGANQEIVIGAIVPLTGEVSLTSGRPTLKGIELAAQEVNDAGGLIIKGKPYPVILKVADNEDDPNTAAAVATQLINQDDVVALVGIPLSRNAIPVAKVAEEAAIPMISSKSTNPETTAQKQYVFRSTFTDTFQAEVIAKLVKEELQLQRAAVLYDVASEYNKYLAESFQTAFEALGGEIVAFETYVTGDRLFTAQLETIQAAQPDVLFLPNYPVEVLDQAQQVQELGLDVTLIGADAWTGFGNFSDPSLTGSLYTSDWSEDLDNDQTPIFIAAYRQQYDEAPTSAAALSYDATQLLFQAIRDQENFEPAMIREGLAQIRDYPGVTGSISYGNGGDPRKDAAVLRVEDGQGVFFRLVRP
ncbi:MAG: ABC transporter substrate-binding protein [Cyanobacteria bacterium P01_G01_bin.54]